MILMEELQAVWKQIKIPNRGEQVDARELSKVNLPYGSPLITIDEHKQRHLLIPIPETLETQSDTKSNGIHVSAERWGIYSDVKTYIDIKCLKPNLSDLFNLVALDVLDEVVGSPEHPDRIAHAVLERWRDLILNKPSKAPKQHKIVGLFGELWFLRELARRDVRAVDLWKGPAGERYDFYSGKTAAEIKTSRSISGNTAIIHGHMQLESPPNGPLYLVYIQTEIASKAKESLQSVIDELLYLGCDQRKLYTILVNIGATSAVLNYAERWRFNVIDTRLYLVDSLFPKITRFSFSEGNLPAGVTDIQYKIDLNTAKSLTQDQYIQLIEQFIGELINDPFSRF